ncbi:MAG TPA: CDP-alcohol phosphatidyltransferase family protein [Phycisphaerae bacterium]|nr:CDP-alcohol phosphatidyltransferase family protein [Phycisphaerae bacterium]
MYRYIPNLITVSRLVLTALFFIVINLQTSATNFPLLMWLALGVFVLAIFSDALDGWLARHWKAETAFGRIVDPFADKILICGAFVFFSCGKIIPGEVTLPVNMSGDAATGIVPWMAVVLTAREFLITGIRGYAESRGIDFRAQWAGKIKMMAQCSAIIGVLVCLALGTVLKSSMVLNGLLIARNVAIWITVVVTVLSAIQYIIRGRQLIHEQ